LTSRLFKHTTHTDNNVFRKHMARFRRSYRRSALRTRRRTRGKRTRASILKSRRSRPRRGFKPTQRMLTFGGFPQNCIVKMRYCEQILFNTGISGATEYNFRANDVYDPNITGGGHQPMGFDQWMAVFNHFVVLGSKITVTPLYDSATTVSPPCLIGVGQFDTTGRMATKALDEITEISATMKNRHSYMHLISSNHPKSVRAFYSARKEFQGNPATLDKLIGSASNSPTEASVFTVYAVGATSAVDPAQVYCNIVIDYVVKFLEPRPLGQS